MKVIGCLATSLDGKIAPDEAGPNRCMPIGSPKDLAHLLQVRDTVEAILIGASTFRSYPKPLRPQSRSHYPLHAIVTRGSNLLQQISPDAPLFQEADHYPIVIFTGQMPNQADQRHYPASVQWYAIDCENPVPTICGTLESASIKTLCVEGGGEIIGLFLQAKRLEELYLTLCPLFLGGGSQHRLLSSTGFSLTTAPKTEILRLEQSGQEVFLHLKLTYPSAD